MSEKLRHEILYPDGSTEHLIMTAVGPNLYRLEESSLLGEAVFGDVIEVGLGDNEILNFRRVAIASELNTVTVFLTSDQMNAPGLQALLDKIMSLGGNWERAFGGLLIVHLPVSVPLDISAEVNNLVGTKL
jgi:hypothetical protein